MVGRLGGAEKASCSHCDCGVVVRFACYFVGFQRLVRKCWVVEKDNKEHFGIVERFACRVVRFPRFVPDLWDVARDA